MSLRIEEVDPFDDDALAGWVEVTNAVDEFERGAASTPFTFEEVRIGAREPSKSRKTLRFSGYLDGARVATGQVQLPLLDNLSAVDLEVCVLPEHRRRGIGSQVLTFCEDVAKEHGRSRFDAMAAWPYDGPADGAGTAGVEFAVARGYVFGLGDVQREVVLPIPDTILDELAAEAARHTRGYELRTWQGPFPDDDLLLSYLKVASTLLTEAPTGDLDYEDEAVDVEAHRIHERVLAKQRRTQFTTVALDSSGEVAAFTDLLAPSYDTRCVYQWGTLVSREHRGHRLGLAVKVANLRALQATGQYDGRRLVTWNAEVNDHMIGINDRMGFVPTARAGELQKKIA